MHVFPETICATRDPNLGAVSSNQASSSDDRLFKEGADFKNSRPLSVARSKVIELV